MRDPKRIEDVCSFVRYVWEMVPDLRFGQLVLNVFSELEAKGKNPFYLEDNEMMDFLEEYGAKITRRRAEGEQKNGK